MWYRDAHLQAIASVLLSPPQIKVVPVEGAIIYSLEAAIQPHQVQITAFDDESGSL